MLTLNEIQKLLTDFADAHNQIAAHGTGDFAELNPTERSYPLMWIQYVESEADDGVKSDTFRVGILDRVNAGEEGQDDQYHELEVLSDTQLIALDLLAYFVQGQQTEYWSARATNLLPATEQFDDRIAGHFIDITVSQNWDHSKCQIPASFGSPASSVDNLTLYDFCDASVIARLTAEQVACLETEYATDCDPVTVNINAVESGTPASGATYNIDVHSEDGDDVGSVSGSVVTIMDSKVQINATTVGDVDSEDTFNIACEYEDAGGTVGSLVGGVWTIPLPTCPSVAVGLSNSTPTIGDTVTVTATPTNTTPTQYIFIRVADGAAELLQDSASNVLNWEVLVSGAFEIFVLSNESGSDEVYGSATGTATGFLFDNYGTADAVGYSFDRLRGAYAGPIVTIRRSSDNAEEDFYLTAADTFDMTSETSGGTSLSDWIGSDSGYVTTRYDQGLTAKHRTQITQAAQPKIVDAGVLVTRGSKAAIYYDGTDDQLISAAATGESDVDCWYIFEPDSDTIYIHQYSSGSAYGLYCRDANTSTTIHNNYGSPTFRADGAAITIANRNEAYDKTTPRKLVAHLGADLTLWSTYNVGYYGGGGLSSTGWEQDYIIYPSGGVSAGDITGIETDINTRFSLY
jgi:hypothetical protein